MKNSLTSLLDFEPLFWILCPAQCKAMAVKRHDKYEFFGQWLTIKDESIVNYPACLSRGHLHEYRACYDFSSNPNDVLEFLTETKDRKPLDMMQMMHGNHDPSIVY